MKTLVIVCVLAAAGFGVVQGFNEAVCLDLGETINEGCVNCTCIESSRDATSLVWSCVQTCRVCPVNVVSQVCLVNLCSFGLDGTCRLYPNALCEIPRCDTCEHRFLQDGNLVNCTDKPGMCPEPDDDDAADCSNMCSEDMECPNNTKCCSNGCGTACSEPDIDDEKRGMCPMPNPDVAGICVEACSGDSDCQGRHKCCSNGCGRSCQAPKHVKLGMCPMPNPDVGGICVQECSGDSDCQGPQKCCSNGCGRSCQMPVPPCPSDQPFMNCTYNDVCSSPCTALPSARCLVDHCGCRPVHITANGARIDCTSGEIVRCPPGVETVNCLVNPCDNPEECTADPSARCISVYCGDCKAVFVNTQGEHVNCTSGDASVCTHGKVVNPADTAQACAMATCPANPRAKCIAKKCVRPNSPLECPYEFFDARARPVQCSMVKRGRCPRMEPSGDVGGICVNECMDDTQCEEDEKCCRNECGGSVCRDPEDDDDDSDMDRPGRKPGTCPMVPVDTLGICVEECMSDDGCEGRAKCCSNGCGHVCMGPREVILKPGTCPMPSMGMMVGGAGICVQECNPEYGDAGCPRHWKCCSNGCGHTCSAPKEMPGQCPMVPEGVAMGDDCQDECTSDRECQSNKPGSKCCRTGCGARCMMTVTSRKPGTCPMVPVDTLGICVEECMGDDDCRGRAKCCSNGCGHVCMGPREAPGDCPAKPNMMMLLAAPQVACSSDGDCGQRRSKCCAYGCGQICVEPVRDVKRGMCPMPDPDVAGICVEECSGDEECPGPQKCCSNGCGNSCQKPVLIRCDDEELPEICEFDPCAFASCPSEPSATCAPDMCGRCRPKFFNEDSEEVTCAGQKFCRGLGDDNGLYETGHIMDSSDGCQQCVCNNRLTWTCSDRECRNDVTQVSLVFNVSFDRIMQRKNMFIGKLKKILSMKFGLPANSMRDFKLRRGSVVVDFKVSRDETTDVNIDEAVEMMGTEVSGGGFAFEFEGEEVRANPDSFRFEPYGEPECAPDGVGGCSAATGPVYSAIGVMAGILIMLTLSV